MRKWNRETQTSSPITSAGMGTTCSPPQKVSVRVSFSTWMDIRRRASSSFAPSLTSTRFWPWLQMVILLVGGAIVIWIGIGLLRDHPTMDNSVDVNIPLPKIAAKAFVVTWCNPQALIDGTMLFGSFHANNPGAVSTQLILGSSSASFLWFFGITVLISLFSAKFNDKILRVINIICGIIIIFYGGKLIWNFFQMIL